MPLYTVKTVSPTGKQDPTYGDEYLITFEEDAREVRISRKKLLLPGDTLDGTIETNRFGAYFKKAPFVPGKPQASAPSSTPSTTAPSGEPKYTPYKRTDNSDGMRQGMCINNAANFVNANNLELTPKQWAEQVHSYASELYTLGDLKAVEPATVAELHAN